MSTVTLGGNPVNVAGNFPQPGASAPEFSLTGKDLKVAEIENEPDYEPALAALK